MPLMYVVIYNIMFYVVFIAEVSHYNFWQTIAVNLFTVTISLGMICPLRICQQHIFMIVIRIHVHVQTCISYVEQL